MAALGLRCCVQALSSCSEQGSLFATVCRPLTAVAYAVAELRLQPRGPQQSWHTGSAVVAHGLQSAGSAAVAHGPSCSMACGILPDQGSNPCPLHWQADSQPTTGEVLFFLDMSREHGFVHFIIIHQAIHLGILHFSVHMLCFNK